MSRWSPLVALLLAACSQAYSEAPAAPPVMVVAGQPAATAAPYGVEIVGEGGDALATYHHGGRYYVMGDAGDRYLIRVTNPTDRRVEAVVTVDGLDVIDGEPGDLRKRGYVVPPHGDLEIEGWRTSSAEVATFRFSSVRDSYAGRKGKARNVGVIAVAIFDEVAPQELILEQAPPPAPPPVIYYDDPYTGADHGGATPRGAGGGAKSATGAPAAESTADSVAIRPSAPVPHPPPPPPRDRDVREERECCNDAARRPGLGTEYGEQRYSAATFTRFVRASDAPTAVAELRYNDATGLAALGIDVAPRVSPDEVTRRETADPFPGDTTYARPPAGIR